MTRTKGHTVIVVGGAKKSKGKYYPKYTGNSGSIAEALKAVGEDDVSKEHRAEIAKRTDFPILSLHQRKIQKCCLF